jgi:hypothetical protein
MHIKLSEQLAMDLESLLCDPSPENAECFWRRWQIYKKKYAVSVAGMPPFMKRLFESVDSAGNQTGWEEEYYANRSDWEKDDYAEIAEAVIKSTSRTPDRNMGVRPLENNNPTPDAGLLVALDCY